MKIVNSLNWEFDFGKHENQTIAEAIESYPSSSSCGIVDIYGETQFKGLNLTVFDSLISYLKWAEKEEILTVLPSIWEEIKTYDNLYTKIRGYENGSKDITLEIYNKSVKEIDELKNRFSN